MPDATFGLESAGTPAYVYDLSLIRDAHAQLVASLPAPSELCYSLKANPHPAVLALLREAGCRGEVSSTGELRAALDAGFDPGAILYTGPAKRDTDVRVAIEAGVREFSVDSPQGIDQLDRISGGCGITTRCLLRVNAERPVPGAGLAMTGVPSQFGADLSWVESEPERFGDRANVDVHGLHLYMATNLVDEGSLVDQFCLAAEVVGRLQSRMGKRFRVVDLGGGFGAPFACHGELPRFPTLAGRLEELLDAALAGWRDGAPRVVFESGRFLTATCGRLFTQVLDVKHSHGKRIVVLDSGVNHLGGMSGLRRLPRISPDLVPLGQPRGAPYDCMVAGPLCTPLDTWARNGQLPDVQAGDLLVVPNVGAYALHASLVLFLGHPLPVEIVVERDIELERSRTAVLRESAAVSAEPAPVAR